MDDHEIIAEINRISNEVRQLVEIVALPEMTDTELNQYFTDKTRLVGDLFRVTTMIYDNKKGAQDVNKNASRSRRKPK
jgi:hypothetical protein